MTHQVTNDAERKIARRILRDRGLPTSEVHRMSYAALTAALATHEVSPGDWDKAAQEQAASQGSRQHSGEGRDGEGGDQSKEAQEASGEAQDGEGTGSKGQDTSLDAQVRKIAREEIGKAKVDPAKVQDLVDKAIAERVPDIIKVEIAGEQRQIEGAVHERMPLVLQALAAKCHVWLPGPAGSGKSTLARQAFMALGYTDPEPGEDHGTPRRIHMTGAIETPYQLLGYVSPSGDSRTLYTPFRKAWETGGAFIWDDTDRSNAKAMSAFNEAMANGYCAFPDAVIKAHPDFLCVATANTYGLGGGSDYVGASRMDKATLDRFVFIEIPYDERCERIIAGEAGAEWCRFVQRVRKACHTLGLKHLVTPRATFKGMKLLAAGMDRANVEAATVYAGLDSETLDRVKGAL